MKSKSGTALAVRIGAVAIVGVLLFGTLARPQDSDWTSSLRTGDGSLLNTSLEYIDWGIPRLIDGTWYIENATDFYANPGWITNNASNYYWVEDDGRYHARWVGDSEEYAVAPMPPLNESGKVRVEFDILVDSIEVGSDIPMVLMEEDHEYLTAGSIQFYFSRNATSYNTYLETFDDAGAYSGAMKGGSFELNESYHVLMSVDYLAQMACVNVSMTGSTSELYNLSLDAIGDFTHLPRVGFTSVGITGGEAVGYLDNFTVGLSYSGDRVIDALLSKESYRTGEGVTLKALYGSDVFAWIRLPSAPVNREAFASAWNDEERFLIINGGRDTIPYPPYTTSRETWIYYAENQTWDRLEDSPFQYFNHEATWHAAAKRMIVYGGYNNSPPHSKETWSFDPYNNTWAQLRDGLDTLQDPQMVYYPEKELVLLCGGWNFAWRDYCWAYNYSNDTWIWLRNMPAPRVSHTAVWDDLGERMLVFGGEQGYQVWSDKLWAYYPKNDTWIELKSGPYRMHFGASAWDPKSQLMYAIPGVEGVEEVKYLGTMSIYDSNNNTWTTVGNIPIPHRFKHCAFWDSKTESLLVYGGSYADNTKGYWDGIVYNDTWSFGRTLLGEPAMCLTLEVNDPSGGLVHMWTGVTNSTGWYEFSFSLPKDAELGTYNCTIVSADGTTVNFTFEVLKGGKKGQLNIVSVNLTGVYDDSGYVNATVVVDNPNDMGQEALLVLQVVNPKEEPLPPMLLKFTIGAENRSTYYLNVSLPAKTRTGTYSVQVELLNGLPSKGGTLYGYEVRGFEV